MYSSFKEAKNDFWDVNMEAKMHLLNRGASKSSSGESRMGIWLCGKCFHEAYICRLHWLLEMNWFGLSTCWRENAELAAGSSYSDAKWKADER